MRRHLIALAVCGLTSGLASAQSSVTLYGVVDVAIERVKGATSLVRVSSGQQQGSRWGLRDTEDLGGGLKAGFVLESRGVVHPSAPWIPAAGATITKHGK